MHDPYPIPCNRFLTAFSDFVDSELSSARQAELIAHLDDCEGCLHHLRAYRTGIATYRSLESGVPYDFFEMIQTRLAETGGNRPVVVPVAHPRDTDPRKTERLAAFAMAVAATFVIVLSYGTGPDVLDEGQPLMSIASVIPTITQPSLVPSRRRAAPRVRRDQVRATDNDTDVDSWMIAEVEPKFVSARGRVQNRLARLPITREPVIIRAAFNIP